MLQCSMVEMMKSWLVITVTAFLYASGNAHPTLLPRAIAPFSGCGENTNLFRCSGFGPTLIISIENGPRDVFAPRDPTGPGTMVGTFLAELLSVTPDSQMENADFNVLLSFNNSDFKNRTSIEVMCRIGADIETTTINLFGDVQPVENVRYEILSNDLQLTGSNFTFTPVRLSWSNPSPRDVLYYRIVEMNGKLEPIEIRSAKILLDLNPNTNYTFIISAIGPCGQSEVPYSVMIPNLEVAVCQSSDIGLQSVVLMILISSLLGSTLMP